MARYTDQRSVREEYRMARIATAFFRNLSRNSTDGCGARRFVRKLADQDSGYSVTAVELRSSSS